MDVVDLRRKIRERRGGGKLRARVHRFFLAVSCGDEDFPI
jgi:hypothetical protein